MTGLKEELTAEFDRVLEKLLERQSEAQKLLNRLERSIETLAEAWRILERENQDLGTDGEHGTAPVATEAVSPNEAPAAAEAEVKPVEDPPASSADDSGAPAPETLPSPEEPTGGDSAASSEAPPTAATESTADAEPTAEEEPKS